MPSFFLLLSTPNILNVVHTIPYCTNFGGIHLSLQGGEGICRSTAKAGGRNQGQGRRGMVHVRLMLMVSGLTVCLC